MDKTDKDEGYAYPIRVSKNVADQHVQLLLLDKGVNYHYFWIQNFSRLNGKQGGNNKKVFCRYCLHGFCTRYNIGNQQKFYTEEEMAAKLLDHEQNCYVHGEQRIRFPQDDIVAFKNLKHQVKAPWIVYADYEIILKKTYCGP